MAQRIGGSHTHANSGFGRTASARFSETRRAGPFELPPADSVLADIRTKEKLLHFSVYKIGMECVCD